MDTFCQSLSNRKARNVMASQIARDWKNQPWKRKLLNVRKGTSVIGNSPNANESEQMKNNLKIAIGQKYIMKRFSS